ncbi:hypothetical protein BC359_13385 [Priestia flexa]|nr:hypothetical protein BC359_13385 [Priestia flexa]
MVKRVVQNRTALFYLYKSKKINKIQVYEKAGLHVQKIINIILLVSISAYSLLHLILQKKVQ